MDEQPGYTDTPTLPHCEYRVHDATRPRPPSVDPGAPAEGPADPPADASLLFGGDSLDAWEHLDGTDPDWNITDDSVEVNPGTGSIRTTEQLGDCQLHIEWATPAVSEDAADGGQQRGNSGVFLMERYEIQVLDNYENPTYADGYAGAVYGQHPPLVNACRPPGEWQTYDIMWTAPRFENADLDRPARVTVLHNGVLVQHDTEIIGPTTHQNVLEYDAHSPRAPLKLQDHGDRVRFRNIWYRSLERPDGN